ncbi:MAG: hypothetical protein WBI21_08930 [Natronincolaceae bacterium]|jgi:hypothetical protein
MSCILSMATVAIPAEPNQDQMTLNIGVRSVDDVILHGRITDCVTGDPIVGAVIKIINANGDWLCHTFSGCEGFYMLRVPASLAGQTITVAAICSDCPGTPDPCVCPPICPTNA